MKEDVAKDIFEIVTRQDTEISGILLLTFKKRKIGAEVNVTKYGYLPDDKSLPDVLIECAENLTDKRDWLKEE